MGELLIDIATVAVILFVIAVFVREKLAAWGVGAVTLTAARFVAEFLRWIGWGVGLFFRWLGYGVILGRRDVPVKRFVEAGSTATDTYVEKQNGDTSINTGMYQHPPVLPKQDSTERDWVIALATRKRADGSWRYSANAIYEFERGNRNEVMAWVREARQDDPPGRELVVRDKAGERRIPFDEVTA